VGAPDAQPDNPGRPGPRVSVDHALDRSSGADLRHQHGSPVAAWTVRSVDPPLEAPGSIGAQAQLLDVLGGRSNESKQALSMSTRRVSGRISELSPPMTPATATGFSPSQIISISESSSRSFCPR